MTVHESHTFIRDYSFDVLKGLAIIFMVIGHTIGPESPLHNYIYAFHMPLFFMVSGYFAKKKKHIDNIISLYSRLIRPFIFICVIIVLLKFLLYYHTFHSLHIDYEIILNGVGPGWFLLAMFWGRILFNFLIHLPGFKYLTITLAISSVPTFLQWTSLYINLPFCIMQGLSCTFFIAIGYFVKQAGILKMLTRHISIYFCISILLWLNTSIFGCIEMSAAHFKFWIIDYMGAIGGTFMSYCIAKLLVNHTEIIKRVLIQVSIFSLAIFAVHSIDFCVHFWHHLSPIVSPKYMVITILFLRIALFYPIIIVTKHIPYLYYLFVGKPQKR